MRSFSHHPFVKKNSLGFVFGFPLRSEPVHAAVEKRSFANVLQTEHIHEHAGQAEAEATVRWTAEAEAVKVMMNGLEIESLLLGLLDQNGVAMFTLCACGLFQSFPEQVEALSQTGVSLVTHVIERSYGCGVVCDKHKLVAALLLEVGIETGARLRGPGRPWPHGRLYGRKWR